ncbi:MAG: hypothetical protein O3A93_05365 [Chloroflexi bacterium]|nr:hypothetical protein [Chloroflexota bacterium]
MPLDEIEGKMQEARYTGLVKSDMPGRGSIQKYAREYDDIPDEAKLLDEPFTWSRMGEYGLPWEASGFLLEMSRFIQEFEYRLSDALWHPPPRPPSVRQVRWWWRIHQAVPDMEDYTNIYLWAKEYELYELFDHLLGKKINISGLDAYFTYRPWSSAEHCERYVEAVCQKRIPGLSKHEDEFPLIEQLMEYEEFRTGIPGGVPRSEPGKLPAARLREFMEFHLPLREGNRELKERIILELRDREQIKAESQVTGGNTAN